MVVSALIRRDFNRYRRNPLKTALLFALPIIMSAIFALVFRGGTDEISIRVLLWNEDESLLSTLAERASGLGDDAGRLEVVPVGKEGLAMMEDGQASALIHIPEGFTDAFLSGTPTTVEVIKNPSQMFLPTLVEEGVGIAGAALSLVSRVFRPELEQLKVLMNADGFPPDAAVASLSGGINSRLGDLDALLFPPLIGLDSNASSPDDDQQNDDVGILAIFLPGFAVMGVLFLAQSAARDVLRDRESGLLRHLLTAPVSPGEVLFAKCLSITAVSTVGFLLLIAMGVGLGVSWGPPVAVAILVLATAVASAGTLLLIMSLVGSERQGDALTTIVIIVWSMLGGVFMPLSQMPDFLLPLSATTLVFWATDAFNTLILHGGGLAEIVFNLTVLFAAGALFLTGGALVLVRRVHRGGSDAPHHRHRRT